MVATPKKQYGADKAAKPRFWEQKHQTQTNSLLFVYVLAGLSLAGTGVTTAFRPG
jgi:hypothetical protein